MCLLHEYAPGGGGGGGGAYSYNYYETDRWTYANEPGASGERMWLSFTESQKQIILNSNFKKEGFAQNHLK